VPQVQGKAGPQSVGWQAENECGAGRAPWKAVTLTMIAPMAPSSFNASFMLRSQVKSRPQWSARQHG
jgi:hypothetical protein